MVDESLNDVITRVIQDRETVESIIEWETVGEEQKDKVFEAFTSLPFNQLGDLRQAMLRFKEGLDKEIEYWPLIYANRVASHYYDIEAAGAAQRAATTAEASLEVAKSSAEAASKSAEAASKSAKTSTMAFRVSAGALIVTAGALFWSIISPPKHELSLPCSLRLDTTVQEIEARERQLNDRILHLESRLEALATSADEENPDTPSSAGY